MVDPGWKDKEEMHLGRVFLVWLIFMAAEFIHGTLRVLFLAPQVGDFRARQIGAVIGSAIVLAVAFDYETKVPV
jgi:hypothetical protein